MTLYIAQFTAKHRLIQVEENSVFMWRQESGDIDNSMLADKIKRESSIHFFNMIAGKNYNIELEDIKVTIWKTEPFNG
ncbi:GTP-binding protein LepA [Maribacter sp. TH_r10]|uniref:GTP-binding protein LepA n=1 Tax=Maribacter sp. TH_r10 TaxID=3082086 RepID=UPI0029555D3A|nr:GTP-binding protein LepA [Maribacter sp. TH_r10]MDV7137645.1 GTP-binding protein LepA [Maribacter sp. TH_r10]